MSVLRKDRDGVYRVCTEVEGRSHLVPVAEIKFLDALPWGLANGATADAAAVMQKALDDFMRKPSSEQEAASPDEKMIEHLMADSPMAVGWWTAFFAAQPQLKPLREYFTPAATTEGA